MMAVTVRLVTPSIRNLDAVSLKIIVNLATAKAITKVQDNLNSFRFFEFHLNYFVYYRRPLETRCLHDLLLR